MYSFQLTYMNSMVNVYVSPRTVDCSRCIRPEFSVWYLSGVPPQDSGSICSPMSPHVSAVMHSGVVTLICCSLTGMVPVFLIVMFQVTS